MNFHSLLYLGATSPPCLSSKKGWLFWVGDSHVFFSPVLVFDGSCEPSNVHQLVELCDEFRFVDIATIGINNSTGWRPVDYRIRYHRCQCNAPKLLLTPPTYRGACHALSRQEVYPWDTREATVPPRLLPKKNQALQPTDWKLSSEVK